jgi:hypothetical protein
MKAKTVTVKIKTKKENECSIRCPHIIMKFMPNIEFCILFNSELRTNNGQILRCPQCLKSEVK